jgi:hypothetical protein
MTNQGVNIQLPPGGQFSLAVDRSAVGEGVHRTPELRPVWPTTTGDGIGRARRDELHHLAANLGSARFGWFLLPLGTSCCRIYRSQG